jgi:hypothetical protein
MTVPEVAATKVRRFCDAKTPEHLREEMRLEVSTRGNSITIADWRPLWQGAPGDWTHMNIAQLRYDPATRRWTLYWADRNSRWHRYDDLAPTISLDHVLREIDEDPTCIFWG